MSLTGYETDAADERRRDTNALNHRASPDDFLLRSRRLKASPRYE